ncbi:MAG: aminoacyl-tRNA hydrolase [Anaerolineales bacterium]|nr:aminoacyl-tRNA hydrolase [Anaerolineales bacterium]
MTVDQGPFLIAGLGNPGRDYRDSRHNIGFMVVDTLTSSFGQSFGRLELNALLVKHTYAGKRILLAKPQTFMNNSGQSIAAIVRFYKISAENILVISDDLDLPLGKIRLRSDGGSGGHKGLQSIIQHLGTNKFPRLRIGIDRPHTQQDPADYVLQRFPESDQQELEIILQESRDCVLSFINDGIEEAMNRFNAGPSSNGSE